MRPFEPSSTVVHPEYLSTDVRPCTSVEDKFCSKTCCRPIPRPSLGALKASFGSIRPWTAGGSIRNDVSQKFYFCETRKVICNRDVANYRNIAVLTGSQWFQAEASLLLQTCSPKMYKDVHFLVMPSLAVPVE